VELDVGRADVMKLFGHDVLREFWHVTFAAQVGEVKVVQFGGHDLRGGFGGGHVREMAVTSENALFEAPGAARTILEHLHIVVGFEDEDIRGADAVEHEPGHVAEVGDEADIAARRPQKESDGVLGVVRNGKGIHEHIGDFKTRAGAEEVAVEFGLKLKFKFLLRGAVAVNRDIQFGGDSNESLNVVGMFVRN
jgi:hypothetical protein